MHAMTETTTRPARYSVCACGAPLVGTFAWPKKEWICLECGALYEFFGPGVVDATDALHDRYDALLAEWGEIAAKLLAGGVMLSTCASCTAEHEPHWNHATAEEKAAHHAALAALTARAGRAFT
jgi:hypothetical protein